MATPDVQERSPASWLEAAGLAPPTGTDVMVVGRDPVLPARHHVGEAAAAAAGLAAAWAARFGEIRGLPSQRVQVDVVAAATSLLGFVFQSAPGIDLTRHFPAVTDLYRTGDDRLIHLHGGFPHLARGITDLLACEPTAESVQAAVSAWGAEDLEDAVAAAGFCAAMIRTVDEWAAHPQGRAVVDLPGVRIRPLGPAEAETPAPAQRPLSGVRVLDLTRVLAGPTAGRTLSAHGAEVLRVDGPDTPTIEVFAIETGRGKRRAVCDLDDPADVARLLGLVAEADVVVSSYRSGSLGDRGLGAEALAATRPGLIVARVNCYGPDGPWAGRRGWEQLAQSAAGIAHAEDPADPHLIPAAATDYTTGYLVAAGITEALVRRSTEGGSWLVEGSLAQTAAWLTRLGADLDPAEALGLGDVATRQHQVDSAWGELTHLAPIETMSVTPPRWDHPPEPRGASPLAWSGGRR